MFAFAQYKLTLMSAFESASEVKNVVYGNKRWCSHLTVAFLPTAREGNVSTGVCHSFHNRPHDYSVTAGPCYSAVGTHPVGMLSCQEWDSKDQRKMQTLYVNVTLYTETLRKPHKKGFICVSYSRQ